MCRLLTHLVADEQCWLTRLATWTVMHPRVTAALTVALSLIVLLGQAFG